MAETDSKNVTIQKDIPSGKTLTSDPERIPLEMPPPPQPDIMSKAMQKESKELNPELGLPPLPDPLTNKQKPRTLNAVPTPTKPASYTSQAEQPPAMLRTAPPAQQPSAQNIPEKQETIEVPITPVHDPLQKEVKHRMSQVKGPVFISLERYREVKEILYSLKGNSRSLRAIMDEFKGNKKEGAELLTQSVDKLEHIEEDIENINSTLRI